MKILKFEVRTISLQDHLLEKEINFFFQKGFEFVAFVPNSSFLRCEKRYVKAVFRKI